MGRFAQLIKQIARECVNLLFPRGCSGCDAPDEVLCERCSNRLRLCVPFTLQHSTSHTGFACAFYTGTVRQMVFNWKDHGDEECDVPISQALCRLTDHVFAHNAELLRSMNRAETIVLVPAPSSSKSVRRRGRSQVKPLGRALCRHWSSLGWQVHCLPLLRVCSSAKSVQTSGARQRARRASQSIILNTRVSSAMQSATVILLDDIVTTGATINQCAKVLDEHGFTVLCAFAVACTPTRE